MFERFTDRARRVIVLAQEEARMLNHSYIGTEHILLGLIHEEEGVAARSLESLGVSLDAVRGQVEEVIGRGQAPQSGHIPFTPRAKKVLELSLREALQLGHNYIGTEHILLGLLREGEGVAAQVLQRLGADLTRVRIKVIEVLSAPGMPGPDRPLEPEGFTKEWLRKAIDRARRARDLADRLATWTDDPSITAEDILFGLLVTEDRLVTMEAFAGHLGEQDTAADESDSETASADDSDSEAASADEPPAEPP